ncbi:hypothetical protein GCM10027074_60290 [Streptomyces deserti]
MGDLEFWEELRPGTTGELVLAIDIPSGQNEAGFRELVPLLDTGHTVWRAREQTDVSVVGDGLAAYLEPWAEAVRSAGLRVRAVLGHRVGSVLAGALTEMLGDAAGPVPCVLFDPELVDTERVVAECRRLLADDPGLLTASAAGGLERDLDRAAQTWPDDPAAVAARFRSVFLRAAAQPEVRDRATLHGLHRAAHRLSVLALTETYDVLPVWARCTALSSSDPGHGLSRTRAALVLPEARFVAREITLGHGPVEMLTSPAVARTASELLSRPR